MEISRLLHGPMDEGDNQRTRTAHDQSITELKTKKKRRRKPSANQLRDKNQRDTDNSLILNLTLDVNSLRQQVHDCIVQKSLWETRQLIAREQFHARSLQTVDHFFQLFRHGYPTVLTATEKTFLSVLLDENIVVGGGVTGQDQFLEQWKRYKKLFSVRRLTNFSARVVTSDAAGCLVECSGEFEGRVTPAALETVFPHALEDETLVKQVLHRRFVCPTRTLIHLDTSGRVVQYDASSDVFEAMNKLLDSNPSRVVRLMTNAAISEGSLLPAVVETLTEVEGVGGYMQQDYGNTSPASSTSSATNRSSIDFILS